MKQAGCGTARWNSRAQGNRPLEQISGQRQVQSPTDVDPTHTEGQPSRTQQAPMSDGADRAWHAHQDTEKSGKRGPVLTTSTGGPIVMQMVGSPSSDDLSRAVRPRLDRLISLGDEAWAEQLEADGFTSTHMEEMHDLLESFLDTPPWNRASSGS